MGIFLTQDDSPLFFPIFLILQAKVLPELLTILRLLGVNNQVCSDESFGFVIRYVGKSPPEDDSSLFFSRLLILKAKVSPEVHAV